MSESSNRRSEIGNKLVDPYMHRQNLMGFGGFLIIDTPRISPYTVRGRTIAHSSHFLENTNMSVEYKARWITIAGNSKRIKEGVPPPHWRCEIEGESDRHLLVGWTLLGEGTRGNNTQGTKPTATGEEFLAWISYYGDIYIGDDKQAIITLLPLPEEKK